MAAYIPGLRNKGGYIVISDNLGGGVVEHETYQCCHCSAHFFRKVGQGPPAMCLLCNEPTCGTKTCDRCVPFEAKLEAWEGRRKFWKELEIDK